eukprot:TRINITY_DN1483_c0_g1_i1.p1 TRINITY_DN1483_c0_g1~~TRINITY_DN1483_c0_g1_i1.p1  ORF type:complete len:277 (-),score=9.05 TRINITY_DN1483_c0_g1_i1:109-909(-)
MDLLVSVLPESWRENYNHFDYVAGETPFSGVHSIVIGVIVYFILIVVLKAIIGQRFKNTDLRTLQAAHNFGVFLLSLVMFVGVGHEIFLVQIPRYGFFETFCDTTGHSTGRHVFWHYIFYLSKYYEFLDTFLLILKGKDLEFLHVYHHALTAFTTWLALESYTAFAWVGIFLNTGVHCIMYWYYFNASLGHNLWWKKYLTQLQMTQFVINFVGLIFWIYYELTYDCAGTIGTSILSLFTMITFFLLFLRFYLKAYQTRANAKPKTQ